jgi:preprotein translocase subunit SecA
MFVDLMNDIYNTFSERFLKVQLVIEQPPPPPPVAQRPTKRYNAMGILEDIPAEDESGTVATETAVDIGPAETPVETPKPVAARKDPTIVGAGRLKSLDGNGASGTPDWSTVGRNDPCPCGSGKKFKKCHGANL